MYVAKVPRDRTAETLRWARLDARLKEFFKRYNQDR